MMKLIALSSRFRFVKPVSVVKSALPPRNKNSSSPTLKMTKLRHLHLQPRNKRRSHDGSTFPTAFITQNFHLKIVHAKSFFQVKINNRKRTFSVIPSITPAGCLWKVVLAGRDLIVSCLQVVALVLLIDPDIR